MLSQQGAKAIETLVAIGEECRKCGRNPEETIWCSDNNKVTVGMLQALKNFKFESLKDFIGQRVTLKVFDNIPGRIVQVNLSDSGTQFSIQYYHDYLVQSGWFYMDDFELQE